MYNVTCYSLSEDGGTNISHNFKVKEFKCNDGSDPIFISSDLTYYLQKVRDHFGQPVIINSAYRTPEYNKKIGGASKSQHMNGTAVDFYIKNVKPTTIRDYLETLVPYTCGIGVYPNFVHFDVRKKRTRWYG